MKQPSLFISLLATSISLVMTPAPARATGVDLACAKQVLAASQLQDAVSESRVPRPGRGTSVDLKPEMLKRWVDTFPDDYREVAQFVSENLKHVRQAEFEETLFDTMRGYLEQIPADAEVHLLHRDVGRNGLKSGRWVASLLSERFPERRFRIREMGDRLPELAASIRNDKKVHALWVDDASYSGSDLSDSIADLEKSLPAAESGRVAYLVPYASSLATEYVNGYGVQSRFHFGRRLPNLVELLRLKPKASRRPLAEKILEVMRITSVTPGIDVPIDALKIPLTSFEHKLPDGMSMPEFVSAGKIPYSPFRFSPYTHGIQPVYRQVPYETPVPRSRVPRPEGASLTRLDEAAFGSWVQAQKPKLRVAARFLQKNLRLVRQGEFEEALFATMAKYRAKNPSVEPILIYLDKDSTGDKSGRWVAALLRERFPDLGSEDLSIPRDLDRIAELITSNPKARVVLVEDASYSGFDLTIALIHLKRRKSIPMKRVDFLVPFLTSSTLSMAENGGLSRKPVFHTLMPHIDELVSSSEIQDSDQFRENLRELLDGWKLRIPIHVFEHRVPDAVSFPEVLSTGSSPKKGFIPFLNQPVPVYRKHYGMPKD